MASIARLQQLFTLTPGQLRDIAAANLGSSCQPTFWLTKNGVSLRSQPAQNRYVS
jgi:hypothetical protein